MIKNNICLSQGNKKICVSTTATGKSEKTITFLTGFAWFALITFVGIGIAFFIKQSEKPQIASKTFDKIAIS